MNKAISIFYSANMSVSLSVNFIILISISAIAELTGNVFGENIEKVKPNTGEGSQKLDCILPFTLSNDPDDVKFYLFRDLSNPNKSEELVFNHTESLANSSYDANQKTVFLIHGFLSNSSSGMPTMIKKAFLDASVPYNIIVVDWGKLSTPNPNRDIYSPIAYPKIVKRSIPLVSQRVGDFIQFLVDNEFSSLEKIHCIGHSLGAQVSSGTGGEITKNPKNEGKKIARITGLDPAGPLFEGIQVQRRISTNDADFVDIYHTNAGTLGTSIFDEGHVNFFPNGGHHQPGCKELDGGSCSHSFVSKLYAASIQKNFTACLCDPKFIDYLLESSCPGDCAVTALAGDPCPSDTRGQFYFETGKDPFSDDNQGSGSGNIEEEGEESDSDEENLGEYDYYDYGSEISNEASNQVDEDLQFTERSIKKCN